MQDIDKKEDLDKEIRASGFVKEQIGEDMLAFDNIVKCTFNLSQHEHFLNKTDAQEDDCDEEEEDEFEIKQEAHETSEVQTLKTETSQQLKDFRSNDDQESGSESEKEEDKFENG